jgi:hypothetical protein
MAAPFYAKIHNQLSASVPGVRCKEGQMDRQAIIEGIRSSADKYGSSNKQQRTQLVSRLKNASERELFFGLFSFFYDPELQDNQYERQQLAGTFLFSIKPDCPLNLDGAIYAIPAYWDLSVEELPWYLCEKFGQTEVQAFIEDLLPDVEEGDIKNSFKTMLFWTKGYKSSGT